VNTKLECLTLFEWKTAAACPLGQETSNNCKLVDELTGFTYDMTSVTPTPIAVSGATGGSLQLSLCRSFDCGGTQAGACLTVNGKSTALGMANDALYLEDGTLSMLYQGGPKCGEHNDLNSAVAITVVCSRTTSASVVDTDPCTTEIVVGTPAACQDVDEPIDCTVYDASGDLYDLRILTRTAGASNWEAVTGNSASHFYLNVCANLVATSQVN
jgi:insulin-like growth factor 2 receptor